MSHIFESLSGATASGPGAVLDLRGTAVLGDVYMQVSGSGVGTVSLEFSLDGTNWFVYSASQSDHRARYLRANATGVTGSVTALIAVGSVVYHLPRQASVGDSATTGPALDFGGIVREFTVAVPQGGSGAVTVQGSLDGSAWYPLRDVNRGQVVKGWGVARYLRTTSSQGYYTAMIAPSDVV